MIVVLDNYDSFTWNLVQALRALGAEVGVHRNDALSPDALAALRPAGILISPGPGRPEDAGISLEVIRRFSGRVPLLGVCLGHQAIAHAFGGRVIRAPRLMHGRTSPIRHDGRGLFEGLPRSIPVARYHSLVVDPAALPPSLTATAWTAEGELMGLRDDTRALEGVQFHPESFLTPHGDAMLARWLDACASFSARAAPA